MYAYNCAVAYCTRPINFKDFFKRYTDYSGEKHVTLRVWNITNNKKKKKEKKVSYRKKR